MRHLDRVKVRVRVRMRVRLRVTLRARVSMRVRMRVRVRVRVRGYPDPSSRPPRVEVAAGVGVVAVHHRRREHPHFGARRDERRDRVDRVGELRRQRRREQTVVGTRLPLQRPRVPRRRRGLRRLPRRRLIPLRRRLRDRQVIDPEVEAAAAQLLRPLLGRATCLEAVDQLEEQVVVHVELAVAQPPHHALQMTQLCAARVGMAEARPLVRDKRHIGVLLVGEVDQLAPLEQHLVWHPAVEREEIVDADHVEGVFALTHAPTASCSPTVLQPSAASRRAVRAC